jgi:Domain of unknown function DUF302
VLTEIDVQSTLCEKLDEKMEQYVILGACNPTLAHRAQAADRAIGLLLPCNVVVWTADGCTIIEALAPAGHRGHRCAATAQGHRRGHGRRAPGRAGHTATRALAAGIMSRSAGHG